MDERSQRQPKARLTVWTVDQEKTGELDFGPESREGKKLTGWSMRNTHAYDACKVTL